MTTNHRPIQFEPIFDALGDPSRRQILDLLASGPRGVRQLSDDMPVSRSAVSQHLKVLKDADLVTDTADGTRRIYRLNGSGFEVLRSYLDNMWSDGLDAFAAAAREHASNQNPKQQKDNT